MRLKRFIKLTINDEKRGTIASEISRSPVWLSCVVIVLPDEINKKGYDMLENCFKCGVMIDFPLRCIQCDSTIENPVCEECETHRPEYCRKCEGGLWVKVVRAAAALNLAVSSFNKAIVDWEEKYISSGNKLDDGSDDYRYAKILLELLKNANSLLPEAELFLSLRSSKEDPAQLDLTKKP